MYKSLYKCTKVHKMYNDSPKPICTELKVLKIKQIFKLEVAKIMNRIYFKQTTSNHNSNHNSKSLQQYIAIPPVHLLLTCSLSRSLEPQNYSKLFFIKEFILSGILFQRKVEPNHFPNSNVL